MMDIAKLNISKCADEGSVMTLMHPVDGTPLLKASGEPMTITVLGTDSSAFRNKQRKQHAARIGKMARARSRNVDLTISDEESSELFAECTIGWDIVLDGQCPEFSKEAAKDLYMKYSWIREQVDDYIGDRANFFTQS